MRLVFTASHPTSRHFRPALNETWAWNIFCPYIYIRYVRSCKPPRADSVGGDASWKILLCVYRTRDVCFYFLATWYKVDTPQLYIIIFFTNKKFFIIIYSFTRSFQWWWYMQINNLFHNNQKYIITRINWPSWKYCKRVHLAIWRCAYQRMCVCWRIVLSLVIYNI